MSKYNDVYYIERQGEYVEFAQRVQFYSGLTATHESSDSEAYTRYIAEQLKQCIYLDNAQVVSNLQDNSITFDGVDTITATDAVFASGDIGKHIVYKTATGYESGRFEITAYTSTTVVTVNVLQTPTTNIYSDWYLTFSSITDVTQYQSETVGVVADGGYLDDFVVGGATLDLNVQVTHAVIGYRYTGIIKSFSLGFQIQAGNTQATMKTITQFGVRCVNTSGGHAGSSLYHLEPIQELGQTDINYLPTLPIDGTKYVSYSGEHMKDKFFYIVQAVPLPMTIASVIINANYAVTQ